MCRIFGISYGDVPESIGANEIAATLYPALVHQGPHAWGWMAYEPAAHDAIRFFKTPGRCDTTKSRVKQLSQIPTNPMWLVGHLRYATHGGPQQNLNNHPIPHGHIIGIHNGVLRNHRDILKVTGRENDKSVVDSEAIFAAVNKWGPVKGLAKIRGDMVTVWADDRKPERLFLGRSWGRQVSIGRTTKGNIIFASEEQALRWLEPHIRFTKITRVSENRLLTIVNGDITERKTFATPTHPTYTPPTPQVHPVTTFRDWERRMFLGLDQERARARGEILFPRDEPKKSKQPKGKSKGRKARISASAYDEIVDVTTGPLPDPEDNKLYYWDGELMTADEYRLAVDDAF